MPPDAIIFGRSAAMRAVRDRIERIAAAQVPLLIYGESGTGKEVIAKLLHQRSPCQDAPFVKVHCPAIPGTLLESELFGYEKGAFTGAWGMKPGRVEMANRGTLFLDEIAELDPALQAKLLQLLQDGQFSRIGGREDRHVELRVICATNRDLADEIRKGTFRADLFYRINVVSVHLAPLRDRADDIPDLVDYFLHQYAGEFGCSVPDTSPRVRLMLQRFDWPGNIRQLENLMKRLVILGSEDAILSELPLPRPEPGRGSNGSPSLKQLTRRAVQDLEREIILKALQAHNWNRKESARALKISYRALLYKIKEAGLPSKRMSVLPDALER